MSKVDDGGSAFPVSSLSILPNGDYILPECGMTLRQYAAIKLRVPNSGTDWLDEMIITQRREDLAAKAMQGMWASDSETWHCNARPSGLPLQCLLHGEKRNEHI